jgi:hypothetical protein
MIQFTNRFLSQVVSLRDEFCTVNFALFLVEGRWVPEMTLTSASVREANCLPIMAVSVLNSKFYLNCSLDFVSY